MRLFRRRKSTAGEQDRRLDKWIRREAKKAREKAKSKKK